MLPPRCLPGSAPVEGGPAVRLRRVDARTGPAALAHLLGEQPQLPGGAAALALEAPEGKAAFGQGPLEENVTERLDVVGDRLQEHRPLLVAGVAVGGEGLVGLLAGAVDLGLTTVAVGGASSAPVTGFTPRICPPPPRTGFPAISI